MRPAWLVGRRGEGRRWGGGVVKDVTPDTVIGGYKHKHRLTSDCKRRAWLDCLGSGLTRLVCLFFFVMSSSICCHPFN